MFLWEIIREFFVKYIFGGTYDGEFYNTYVGYLELFSDGVLDDTYTAPTHEVFINIGGDGFMNSYAICLGDWLSTTATIITLIALLVAITMLIVSLTKWIIRLVSLRG